jgi:hypothetical protein
LPSAQADNTARSCSSPPAFVCLHGSRPQAAAGRTSIINSADQIERGFECIEERLNVLGAKITRMRRSQGGYA